MKSAVFTDRLGLLEEMLTIERDLALYEQQHGWTSEAEELWRRMQVAPNRVLEQLRGGAGRVHQMRIDPNQDLRERAARGARAATRRGAPGRGARGSGKVEGYRVR